MHYTDLWSLLVYLYFCFLHNYWGGGPGLPGPSPGYGTEIGCGMAIVYVAIK